MKQIERLMEYFPIQCDTMIACLAKPISNEFAAELHNMDVQLKRISDPKVKEVIRNHLISMRGHPSLRPASHERNFFRADPDRRFQPSTPARHDVCRHTAAKEPARAPPFLSHPPKNALPSAKLSTITPADPAHSYIAAKYGEGPTPCYVCGKKEHGWVQCPKKKRGKCGVCSSEIHWTRFYCQCYCPVLQARLNFQMLYLEAFSNPGIQLMNTPFDNDDSDIKECVRHDQKEIGEINIVETEDVPVSEVSLCQVIMPLPQKLHGCSLSLSEEMRSAVNMLGGDTMERWGHFLKKICINASTSIFPIVSSSHKEQLLYRIEVEQVPVIAFLDYGASYSFISREWA